MFSLLLANYVTCSAPFLYPRSCASLTLLKIYVSNGKSKITVVWSRLPHDKLVDDFPLPVPEVSPNSSLETAVFGREQSQNCGYTDNLLEIRTSGAFNSGCWNWSSQEYLGTFDWGLGYDGMLGGFPWDLRTWTPNLGSHWIPNRWLGYVTKLMSTPICGMMKRIYMKLSKVRYIGSKMLAETTHNFFIDSLGFVGRYTRI